jgi:hypothetical protein
MSLPSSTTSNTASHIRRVRRAVGGGIEGANAPQRSQEQQALVKALEGGSLFSDHALIRADDLDVCGSVHNQKDTGGVLSKRLLAIRYKWEMPKFVFNEDRE